MPGVAYSANVEAGLSQITLRSNVVLSLRDWAYSDSPDAQGNLDAAE
jgi:hypothetical protein